MQGIICYFLPFCITCYVWARWSPWIAIPVGLIAMLLLSFAFFGIQVVFSRITGRSLRVHCDKCGNNHAVKELANRGLFRGKMTDDRGQITGAVFECPECRSHILHNVISGGDRLVADDERSEEGSVSKVEVKGEDIVRQMAGLLRSITTQARDMFSQYDIDSDEMWAYIAFTIANTALANRVDSEEINTFFNVAAMDYGGSDEYSELFGLLERRSREYAALICGLDVCVQGALLHAMKTVSINVIGEGDLASVRLQLAGLTAEVATQTKALVDGVIRR